MRQVQYQKVDEEWDITEEDQNVKLFKMLFEYEILA